MGVLASSEPGGNTGIGLAGIATVQEFGAAINGTAFGNIIIPERSFIRSTMDEKEGEIAQLSERLWNQILEGKLTKFQALERMGIFISAAIRRKVATLKDPPNAEATIALKGFDNPLIGPTPAKLQKSIDYVVRES